MVTPTIVGDALVLEINGLDKFWTLRSRLDIPLAHVRSVKPDPGAVRHWFDGLKLAGSHIPGLLTAGTFYEDGELVFWDVHHAENAISIDLDHDRYRRLVIEVADPKAVVQLIEQALRKFAG